MLSSSIEPRITDSVYLDMLLPIKPAILPDESNPISWILNNCNDVDLIVTREIIFGFTFVLMRLSAFIMSVVVLALSFMPCRDNDAMVADNEMYHIELSHKNGQEHQPHADLCSPLCICACCSSASTTVPIPLTIDAIILRAAKPAFIEHYTGSVTAISLPIWQPPQRIA